VASGVGDVRIDAAERGTVATGAPQHAAKEMDWAQLDTASLVVMQKMMVVFYEVLTESSQQVCAGERFLFCFERVI
jgi:hypothetical protein